MEENEESVWRTCGRRAQQGAEVRCLFFGDSAALNASCPATLEYLVGSLCPHMLSMVHRDKYGCDLGTGEDIAAAVVYLASKEAGYVTGQTLHVNGGMAMI